MNSKKQFLALVALSTFFISCSNDDDSNPSTQTYDIPETYTFERNNSTSVDYSGQNARILMLQEMGDYYKTQGTAGTIANFSLMIAICASRVV